MSRLLLLLSLLFFLHAPMLSAASVDDADIAASIAQREADIAALADSGKSAAEQQELQQAWQSTITALQKVQSLNEQREKLTTTLDQAPAQISALNQQIAALRPLDPKAVTARFAGKSLEELDGMLGELVARMYDWQNELMAVNSELIAAETRPEQTQNRIAANQTRSNELNEQLRQLQRQNPSALTKANTEALEAELLSLERSSELLRQQLGSNNSLLELTGLQRALLNQNLQQIDQEIDLLQDAIDDKRRSMSRQVVSETSDDSLSISNHQLLREQSQINQRISEELLESTNQISQLSRRNIRATQQIDYLTQLESALDQQIEVLQGSLLLSRILHKEKQALPQVSVDRTLTDSVADMRLQQFEISQLRDKLRNKDAYLQELLKPLPEDQRDELREDLTQLMRSRTTLIDQLNNNIHALLGEAIALQISESQLQQLSSSLRRTIDDQLFWIASNPPIDRDWLLSLPRKLQGQWQTLAPVQRAQQLAQGLWHQFGWLIAVLLLTAGSVWSRPFLMRQQLICNSQVGHFQHDSQRTTPLALLLTAGWVLPLPILLSGLGLILSKGSSPIMPALGTALLRLALCWFLLHLMYRLCHPQGVTLRHFRWSGVKVARLRHLTRLLAWVLMPMVLVISLASSHPEHLDNDVLGRLIMIISLGCFSFLVGRLMYRSEPLNNSRIFHTGATVALVLTPLILLGMTIWGFHYTAIRLADRMIDTLYLITLWILIQGVVMRNLGVAGRHLAYQRALSKRAAETANNDTVTDIPVDVPELNLQQINQQSLRLARLGLLILFSVLVYLVWADLLSAASYLESITLWEYNSGTTDNPLMMPLSAGHLLGAILIVVLTLTFARNLPGLLEILVLSRMELRQGSSYAVTTLLSYLIVGVGIVTCLSTLGVSWGKLQWLVAALGVGLGFGLQEIFANFVSGLIILFERPVRIGDVVTIGNLSGTVNRIRIRATTIVDFDRKEIIVPNKTFVTEYLVNWTLSDTITKVTVKLGVAYGSDLNRVRELLLQIAKENPRILPEPEPVVLFLNYGGSTLEHELRVHVLQLGDRNAVIDEINRAVDRLFAAENIDLAFPQLDLHLRSSEGLERLIAGKKD